MESGERVRVPGALRVPPEYGGLRRLGQAYGVWKGELHVEGDYVANCLKHPEMGMVRGGPTKLREGDAVGWGIHE